MHRTRQTVSVISPNEARLTVLDQQSFLAAPVILLALISFGALDGHALWNDEAFSFFVAWHGPETALRLIHFDSQPPLYYLLLSLWLKAGTSIAILRSFSALAAVLSLFPAYFGITRLFGTRVANLAALFFAINPNVIAWAHTARPYALQVLLVAVSFWGFARLWSSPAFETRTIGAGLLGLARGGRDGANDPAVASDIAGLTYAVGGGLAMLVQYPAGFFLLACNLAMLLRLLIRPGRSALLVNWIVANLMLIAVFSLWSGGMMIQFSQHLSPEEIALKHKNYLISASNMYINLESILSIAFLWRLRVLFVALYAGLFLVSAATLCRRHMMLPMLVLSAAPVIVCVAGFYLIHPVLGYVIYTFIWIQPIYIAVIAFGFERLPTTLRAAAMAVMLVGNAWGVSNFFGASHVPLDEVAASIRPNLRPGDGLILSTDASMRWGIAYYLGADRHLAGGLDVSELGRDKLIRSLEAALHYHRLWVAVLDNETPAVSLDALRQHARGESRSRVGNITVYRFDLVSSPAT